MTSEQVRCLDLYEKELRPGLAPIDRNVDLNIKALAVRVREVRAMLPCTKWPTEKVYAAAIIWLSFLGYDPEEEAAITERVKGAIPATETRNGGTKR